MYNASYVWVRKCFVHTFYCKHKIYCVRFSYVILHASDYSMESPINTTRPPTVWDAHMGTCTWARIKWGSVTLTQLTPGQQGCGGKNNTCSRPLGRIITWLPRCRSLLWRQQHLVTHTTWWCGVWKHRKSKCLTVRAQLLKNYYHRLNSKYKVSMKYEPM